jgi:excisionase family DNA binding protein
MYVSPQEAARRYGCTSETLRRWANNGKIKFIKTSGGQRRYLVDLESSDECSDSEDDERKTHGAVYVRVSSRKQKNDLERQKKAMSSKYPKHEIFADIGSGLNYKRKNLLRLLEQVQDGAINEVVVAHKDRLARFGTEIIEWVINQAGANLIILDAAAKTNEEELTDDLMAIVHVFSCRANGRRRYTKKKRKSEDDNSGEQRKRGKSTISRKMPEIQNGSDTAAASLDPCLDEGCK